MRTIIFIGTQKSGSSREAIKAADRLGLYTVLLTENPNHLDKRAEFPDVKLMKLCDLKSFRRLHETIKELVSQKLEICAIISFVDPYCHMACLLADEFGVGTFTTRAIGKMEDKIFSREALEHTPYVPKYMVLSENLSLLDVETEYKMPFIMKSPNSSGSKDVFKIDNEAAFEQHLAELKERYPHKPILIEEYLDGPQYLVETVVYKRHVHIIAVIEQEITFFERFIVTGYNFIIDATSGFYYKLRDAVEAIIASHGMVTGTCHLEMRLVNDEWKLVEINPRISGGGMNRMIQASSGISLVEETLKLALKQDFSLCPKYRRHVFAKYLTVSEKGVLERVIGKSAALDCPGVEDVYIKPRKGTLLIPPLSMGNRYAYVIATGDSESEAKKNAAYAASQIEFVLKPSENNQLQTSDD